MYKILILISMGIGFGQSLISTKEFNFYKDRHSSEINILELISEKDGLYKVELINVEDLVYERTKQILVLPCELELIISSSLSSNKMEYKLCKNKSFISQYLLIDKSNPVVKISSDKFNFVEGNFVFRISGKFTNIRTPSLNETNGILKEWHDNGQLYLEFSMKNGIKNGICKKWYDNGQLQMIYNYHKGRLHGNQKKWYDDGKLRGEWNYSNDILHGISKEWYENGDLKSIKKYKNGELISSDNS